MIYRPENEDLVSKRETQSHIVRVGVYIIDHTDWQRKEIIEENTSTKNPSGTNS